MILSVLIQEPMTALTDLVVTAVCFYAFFRLRRKWETPLQHERLYLLFFLLMGLCTLFGAFLSHAFAYAFEGGLRKFPNWVSNILSVTCYPLALVGRADQVRHLPARKVLYRIILVETALFLFVTIWCSRYLFAEIHIAFCLYLFALPMLFRIRKDGHRQEVRPALVAAVLMSTLPFILIAKLGFGEGMNHNDISHLIIAASMCLYYRAGLQWRS